MAPISIRRLALVLLLLTLPALAASGPIPTGAPVGPDFAPAVIPSPMGAAINAARCEANVPS